MKKHKKKSFYNNPFLDKKELLPDLTPQEKPKKKAVIPKAPKKVTEKEYFEQAMLDVKPLSKGQDKEIPIMRLPPPIRDDDQLALQVLEDLVQGKEAFELRNSDEYVEGCIHGLDPRILRRLRNGDYAWQAYLDLHGMRVDEARGNLIDFIQTQHKKGRRCLLIIHGRGHHSFNQEPVLKSKLIHWLTNGFLHKQILAFTSARPSDGGVGALYLLLRRHTHFTNIK